LTTLDNADKKVSEKLLKDRITILNVWSTDCGACKDEHPYLIKLVKNNEVALIGVDLMDDRSSAQNWLTKEGNPYEVVIFDDNGKLSKGLGVYGTPQTFIIDHQGIIRFSHLGELTDSVWRSKMQPLIKSLTKDMEASKAKLKDKASKDSKDIQDPKNAKDGKDNSSAKATPAEESSTTKTTSKTTTSETTKD
jgi:cytochrome c biogenesis protein CcmG/thiol:disulfide interchange protein DsbE